MVSAPTTRNLSPTRPANVGLKAPGKPAAAESSPVKQLSAAALKQRKLKLLVCTALHEEALREQGFRSIAGVDEVGRGALFGPVVTAAVVLPAERSVVRELTALGLKDSKQLPEKMRETLDAAIRRCALSVALGEVDAATIDRINIYQATRLAMVQAVRALSPAADHLLIDAMRIDHPCPQTKLIYGDALSVSIAAASIVAKVYRDALMRSLHHEHPVYGLATHKGYGTPMHLRALRVHGPSPLHRHSFAPVAEALAAHEALAGKVAKASKAVTASRKRSPVVRTDKETEPCCD